VVIGQFEDEDIYFPYLSEAQQVSAAVALRHVSAFAPRFGAHGEFTLRDTLSYGRATELQLTLLESERGEVIRVTFRGAKPAWFDAAIADFKRLLRLPEGWNAEAGRAISAESVAHTLLLLDHAMSDGTPNPGIIPTNRGAVALVWHTGGIDLEVEVLPDGRYSVSFEDGEAGAEWDVDYGTHLERLREILATLARHRAAAEPPDLAAG
jgi:hypothetical protein